MGMDAELVRQNKALKESVEALAARNRRLAAECRQLKEGAAPGVAPLGREALIGAYLTVQADKRRAAARMEEIRALLMEDLAGGGAKTYGRYRVAARLKTRRTFDRGAFAEAHPDIDLAPYFREKTERPLEIKEAGK